jgi:hypothetical protein
MNTIHVRAWHPLVCPQRIFRDKDGDSNAYVDTNPAFHLDVDGSCTILVRQVNYRKFRDKSFKLGELRSISGYHIFRGTYIDGVLAITHSEQLVSHTDFPTFPTYWLGAEDLRFLDAHTILATYPELHPGGAPRMVLGFLQDSSITYDCLLEPSVRGEKNWMPFGTGGGVGIGVGDGGDVIYSVSPLAVKPLKHDVIRILAHDVPILSGYHGSTNGVAHLDGWLFLIHKYVERTEHRWLFIDFNARTYAWSDPFVFMAYSYIEFPCSLTAAGPDLVVAIGINDDKAYLVTIMRTSVCLGEPVAFCES